jgi:DNA-binding XRE family transcriptional regulator
MVRTVRTHEQVMARMSPKVRAKVKARAQELAAEEMSLRDLRKAQAITQADLAKTLGVKQSTISQTENSVDLYLSTLRKHVEAMGGELKLWAVFPDRQPVLLSVDDVKDG